MIIRNTKNSFRSMENKKINKNLLLAIYPTFNPMQTTETKMSWIKFHK